MTATTKKPSATKKPAKPAAEDHEQTNASPNGAPSPAEASAAEAQGIEGSIEIEFRGEKFAIERSDLGSARFRLAIARNDNASMIVELLPNQVDQMRLVATVARGENIVSVAAEFLGAINTAAGFGDGRPNS